MKNLETAGLLEQCSPPTRMLLETLYTPVHSELILSFNKVRRMDSRSNLFKAAISDSIDCLSEVWRQRGYESILV